jgi:hypothetical protein
MVVVSGVVILKGSGLRPYDSGEVKAYAVPKMDRQECRLGEFIAGIEDHGF